MSSEVTTGKQRVTQEEPQKLEGQQASQGHLSTKGEWGRGESRSWEPRRRRGQEQHGRGTGIAQMWHFLPGRSNTAITGGFCQS